MSSSRDQSPLKGLSGTKVSSTTPPDTASLHAAPLYLDRDLSLIEFQHRVLEEAKDESNPLLERVKFLGILGSNIDEYAIIRGAEIKRSARGGVRVVDEPGVAPIAHLERIQSGVRALLVEARRHFHQHVVPELAAAGIHVVKCAELAPRERAEVDAYFHESILPVLMPLAVVPDRKFPHVSNLGVNLLAVFRDNSGHERFAFIRVPESIPQFVPVHWTRKHRSIEHGFVWIEDVIMANLTAVFRGRTAVEAHPFRVVRDAELPDEQIATADLLDAIEEGVRRRHFGPINALLVHEDMPARLAELLAGGLRLAAGDVYRTSYPFALSRLLELARLDRPDLHDPPVSARTPAELAGGSTAEEFFERIRREDILLHHPYDSFQPVVDFLHHAARDPNVLGISMTLYRVGAHSPVVKALLDARRHGKDVRVVVELKARFDEESNAAWARALERAHAHVVHSPADIKVHAKVAMVVRREGHKLRRYVHLSTGNYNAATARVYTDLALFTADQEVGADVTDFLNFLTGHSAPSDFRKLLVAPTTLRERLRELIRREIRHARHGKPARLIFKMNALVDPEMIQLLYQASQAGVRVDLFVRGICCLRPGVPGASDNITVRSIVGRFLEHSRIYLFQNGAAEEIYLGSADLMPRNLDRRAEVLFPVRGSALRRVRDEIITALLADNIKARQLNPDGTYTRVAAAPDEPLVSSQELLLQRITDTATRPDGHRR